MKLRTLFLLFINIQSNRWQHVNIHTLVPARSLHVSSLQDRNTAIHIHVSTYRLHFTLYNITNKHIY
jgi:hypothetical protein